MSKSPPLVYIDASVFAYRLLLGQNSDMKAKSISFFQDIQRGTYLGIISTFTIMEYRGLAKKAISTAKKVQVAQSEEDSAMKDFGDFVDLMGIGKEDSDLQATNQTLIPSRSDLFSSAEPIIIDSTPFYNTAPKKWRDVGAADALMTIFAERCGASFIITCDFGFKGLVHPTITPILLQEVY